MTLLIVHIMICTQHENIYVLTLNMLSKLAELNSLSKIVLSSELSSHVALVIRAVLSSTVYIVRQQATSILHT